MKRRVAQCIVSFALATSACTSAPETDVSRDELADVPQSRVKKQAIGNCWLFSTVAWVESLSHAEHGVLDLSEAYLTYFAFHDKIREGAFEDDGKLDTGGTMPIATDLIWRFGLMTEADFGVTTERTKTALDEIDRELAPGGALASATKRRDGALVKSILDRAFRLPAETSEMLEKTFGKDLQKSLHDAASVPKKVIRPEKLVVGYRGEHPVTLADAIDGPLAWATVVPYPEDASDDGIARVKETLNTGFAIPIAWEVDSAHAQPDGSYRVLPGVRSKSPGRHMSVIDDYQIKLSDGRTLPAGRVANPDDRIATLDPGSQIEFFRVKNSWGFTNRRGDVQYGSEGFRGYNDLYWSYLFPPRGSSRVIELFLPPRAWLGVRRSK